MSRRWPFFPHRPSLSQSTFIDTMNTDSLQKIWTDVQSSLEAFQADGTEYNRIDALEKATQLARALEKPRDAILKLAYTVSS